MSSVQSVERAFAILKVVAAHPEGVGVTEIANRVGLPVSTVARLLTTLTVVGAVERVPGKTDFQMGAEILSLISQATYERQLTVLARPSLLELAVTTGEAVALCMLEGEDVCVIDLIRSQRRVRVKNAVGDRYPLHATSPGKILLAYLSDAARENYLARPLERFTENTVTDSDELRLHLDTVREQGVAWVHEELDEITGVSAPIQDSNGNVVAALNVYGPASRFPPEGATKEITYLVLKTAEEISARIHPLPPGKDIQ